MSDLRPQARRVLADYAAIVGPDEPTAMQNWSGLVRRIERDEPEIDLGAAPPTRGRTRARLVVAGVVAFAAAAAVLWLGGRATVAALAIEDSPSAASWQSGVTTDPGESANVVDRVIVIDDDAQPRPRVRPEIPATSVPAVAPVVVPPPAPVAPRVVPRKAKPSNATSKPAHGSMKSGASKTACKSARL